MSAWPVCRRAPSTAGSKDVWFPFDVEHGDGIEDGRDGLYEYEMLETYCHIYPASGAFYAFIDST